MSSGPALLDTDILSALMRKQPAVVARARDYTAAYGQFTISIISRYEILRGLKAKGAALQEDHFNEFCAASRVLPVTEDVAVRAAEIYASLFTSGQLIGDADILLAATALVNGLTLVTNNEDHFRRISGLEIDNWLK